jgi:hypothetical protein
MPRTCPFPILPATARAAAPGPQPISRTRRPGRNGRAATASASRCDKPEAKLGSRSALDKLYLAVLLDSGWLPT